MNVYNATRSGLFGQAVTYKNTFSAVITNTAGGDVGTNFMIGVGTAEAASIPEPSTFALLPAAVPVLLAFRWWKVRR